MRNFFSVLMIGLLLMGCSVDNDETIVNEDQLLIANSVLNVDGCESVNYNLKDGSGKVFGQFTVTNNKDNLYLNFAANSGLSITEIAWEVARDVEGLPANNGGIIYGQLENKQSFPSGVEYHGETLTLEDFERDLVIAAKVTFENSKQQKFSVSVGDQLLGKKDSKFLFYSICEPQDEPVCLVNAGRDQYENITFEFRRENLRNETDIKNFYLSLLDEDATLGGILSPSPREIMLQYNASTIKFGEYTTKYTVIGEDGCEDFAVLTLNLIP